MPNIQISDLPSKAILDDTDFVRVKNTADGNDYKVKANLFRDSSTVFFTPSEGIQSDNLQDAIIEVSQESTQADPDYYKYTTTNTSVTVGPGGDFESLAEAIETHSRYLYDGSGVGRPLYKDSGTPFISITLLDNFLWNESIVIDGGQDMSHVTIFKDGGASGSKIFVASNFSGHIMEVLGGSKGPNMELDIDLNFQSNVSGIRVDGAGSYLPIHGLGLNISNSLGNPLEVVNDGQVDFVGDVTGTSAKRGIELSSLGGKALLSNGTITLGDHEDPNNVLYFRASSDIPPVTLEGNSKLTSKEVGLFFIDTGNTQEDFASVNNHSGIFCADLVVDGSDSAVGILVSEKSNLVANNSSVVFGSLIGIVVDKGSSADLGKGAIEFPDVAVATILVAGRSKLTINGLPGENFQLITNSVDPSNGYIVVSDNSTAELVNVSGPTGEALPCYSVSNFSSIVLESSTGDTSQAVNTLTVDGVITQE